MSEILNQEKFAFLLFAVYIMICVCVPFFRRHPTVLFIIDSKVVKTEIMDEKKLTLGVKVSGPMGLHCRPAAELVRIAGKFASDLTLHRADAPGSVADCRSVLALLTLAAPDGTELILTANGSDCENAAREIEAFFAAGFSNEV